METGSHISNVRDCPDFTNGSKLINRVFEGVAPNFLSLHPQKNSLLAPGTPWSSWHGDNPIIHKTIIGKFRSTEGKSKRLIPS